MHRSDVAHELALTERQTQRLMNRFMTQVSLTWQTFDVDASVAGLLSFALIAIIFITPSIYCAALLGVIFSAEKIR